jgi:hypothetical protein
MTDPGYPVTPTVTGTPTPEVVLLMEDVKLGDGGRGQSTP